MYACVYKYDSVCVWTLFTAGKISQGDRGQDQRGPGALQTSGSSGFLIVLHNEWPQYNSAHVPVLSQGGLSVDMPCFHPLRDPFLHSLLHYSPPSSICSLCFMLFALLLLCLLLPNVVMKSIMSSILSASVAERRQPEIWFAITPTLQLASLAQVISNIIKWKHIQTAYTFDLENIMKFIIMCFSLNFRAKCDSLWLLTTIVLKFHCTVVTAINSYMDYSSRTFDSYLDVEISQHTASFLL